MSWLSMVPRLRGRVLRALGISAKSRTAFSSFRAYLPELIRYLSPRQALEFGPGLSSRLILSNSASRILSIETDRGYFEKAKREIRDARFDLRHVPDKVDFATLAGQRFDFVFVDGGDRVDNLLGSHALLNDNGVTVLHDAHREEYWPGIERYAFGYFIENHSLLLLDSESRLRELQARFPADDRCRCKYCGTPARIEYRQRVARHLGAGP